MSTQESYSRGGGGQSSPSSYEKSNDWAEVNFAPIDLPNAEGDIWAPGGTSSEMYHVWFYLCERAGGAQTITLGRDYGAGGGLGAGEYWLKSYAMAANTIVDWMGPFQVNGADKIRGLDDGGGGVDVCIHLRIKRIW